MKIKKLFTLLIFSSFAVTGAGLMKFNNESSKLEAASFSYKSTQQEIDNYYSSITDDLTGSDLLDALHSLNNTKRTRTVGYNGLKTFAQYCDADPDGSGKIVGFYENTLIGPSWDNGSTWNREHVWPNSRGGGTVDNDVHMPRPASVQANSSRGSKGFGYDSFDPGYMYEYYRGVCARIIFYCMIANTDLKLSEDPFNHDYNKSDPSNTMGKLSDMLKWNLEYLPTDTSFTGGNDLARRVELNRNEVIQNHSSGQGNRNPFIDHPEYACKIWGNTNSETKTICSSTPTPTPTLESIDVTTLPSKTTYQVGDTLDTTGIVVTATYSDESTVDVTSSCSYSPTTLSTAGNQTITVTYENESTTFNVTVNNPGVPLVSVSASIDAETIYKNHDYQIETTINPTNAYPAVSISYSSSNTQIAEVSESGYVSTFEGGNVDITVTATQNTIVKQVVLHLTVVDTGIDTIESLYSMPSSSSVHFYGLYLGTYGTESYSGIFVGDGEHCVMIYAFAHPEYVSTLTPYVSYVDVTGTISPYYNLLEIVNATINDLSEEVGEFWVEPVRLYEPTGDEGSGVSNNLKLASRPTIVVGTLVSTVSSFSATQNNSVKLTLTNDKEVEIYIKKNSGLNIDDFNNTLTSTHSGEVVAITGFYSIYKNTFQVISPSVCLLGNYGRDQFSSAFLNRTGAICITETNRYKRLFNAYTDLYLNTFAKMSKDDVLSMADIDADEHGTIQEQAMARYDYITAKYDLQNFIGRDLSYISSTLNNDGFEYNSNMPVIVIIIASSVIISLCGVVLIKRRKKMNK